MPEKRKETVGQKFVKLLDRVAEDKEKLLDLACAIIKHSPSRRGLKDRDLPDEATAVRMKSAVAKFNALAGKDVSTDGMLALIADTYGRKAFGSPEKFKKDFAKKYPDEYKGKAQKSSAGKIVGKIPSRAAAAYEV
ncbi:MAG: hypothetical protein Q4D80_04445 [Pseudomonadota bacterium]|nr:hypothetical protein [Pseudomonadota bacterium]